MKKKLLVAVAIVAAALAGVAVVGPSFVDWSAISAKVGDKAREATGRELAIDGDISIAFFPAPALVVQDVRLSNLDGATSPDMARLKSLEVRVALGPILSGEVQVESVRLIEPVLHLERLADGRVNWEFAPSEEKPADEEPKEESGDGEKSEAGGLAPDVRLDNFLVEDARIIFRDRVSGHREEILIHQARLGAGSLQGPFDSSGAMMVRGTPLSFDVSVGKPIEDRTAPLSVSVRSEAGDTALSLAGALIGLHEKPRLKGTVKATGKNLAQLLAVVQGGGALPGFLGQEFALEGALLASSETVDVKDLVVRLADVQGTGAIQAEMGEAASVDASLEIAHVDLDKWLAMKPLETAAPSPVMVTSRGNKATVALAPPPSETEKEDADAGFSLPTGIEAAVDVTVKALTLNGGAIKEVRANAALTAGEIILNQFSAQFPGGADLAVFGFVSEADGKPAFDGKIEAQAGDFRKLLSWGGVDADAIPGDRLRKVSLAGRVVANPETVQVADVDVRFDSSRLQGGVSIAVRERPSFGVDVRLDKINLDAYLKKGAPKAAAKPTTAKANDGGATNEKKAAPKADDPFAALKALAAFDANFKARVGSLVHKGATIKGVSVEGALFDGVLTFKRGGVANAAGASAKLTGKIRNLAGIPSAKNLKVSVAIPDVPGLARLAGGKADGLPKLGPVKATAVFNGAILKRSMALDVSTGGGVLKLNGDTVFLPRPGFAGKMSVKHPKPAALLRLLGAEYRPQGPLGALSLASAFEANDKAVGLSGLSFRIGDLSLKGTAEVGLKGPRPAIKADLSGGELNLDPLLPPMKSAALEDAQRQVRAASRLLAPPAKRAGKAVPVANGAERWPTEPMDFGWAHGFDADVGLTALSIRGAGYVLDDADAKLSLNAGVAKVERLKGRLFDGPLDLTASLDANGRPKAQANVRLEGMNVASALKAASGKASASGRMALNADLAMSGASVRDMVSTLDGSGAIALKNLKVASDPGNVNIPVLGQLLGPILSVVDRINDKIANVVAFLTPRKDLGRADLTGSFRIDDGVVLTKDLALKSGLYGATGSGRVNLPANTIDATIEARLAGGILKTAQSMIKEIPTVLPVRVRGSLDDPKYTIDTKKIPGGVLRIPTDKKSLKKGIKKLKDLFKKR